MHWNNTKDCLKRRFFKNKLFIKTIGFTYVKIAPKSYDLNFKLEERIVFVAF